MNFGVYTSTTRKPIVKISVSGFSQKFQNKTAKYIIVNHSQNLCKIYHCESIVCHGFYYDWVEKHHPPRHFDPDTRLTGHPIPVTLVSGKFFYFIFLFWRKFIFSNFFNNFLSVSFSLSPSLSLFVCTHSLRTFEIDTCRQKDFTGRSDCVGKTEPVVG